MVVFGAESRLQALEHGVLGQGSRQVNEVVQGRVVNRLLLSQPRLSRYHLMMLLLLLLLVNDALEAVRAFRIDTRGPGGDARHQTWISVVVVQLLVRLGGLVI